MGRYHRNLNKKNYYNYKNYDFLEIDNKHGEGHIDESNEDHSYKTYRSGNTFRQKGVRNSHDKEIEFEGNNHDMANKFGNHVEFPVSELELEFPEVMDTLIKKYAY